MDEPGAGASMKTDAACHVLHAGSYFLTGSAISVDDGDLGRKEPVADDLSVRPHGGLFSKTCGLSIEIWRSTSWRRSHPRR